jgi:ferritin-like metal-binding protein YciE
MSVVTLEDLYLEQLSDAHSAGMQALDVAIKMTRTASDDGLVAALRAGADGLRLGIDVLEGIAERHDEHVSGGRSKGMEGLVGQARVHALEVSFVEDATKDAMIMTQYLRIVHYALAGYGSLAAFAERLELLEDAIELAACFDRLHDGDRTMRELSAGRVESSRL